MTAPLNRLITDWAVRTADGYLVSCDVRETAEGLRAQGPHLTVVCRWPGGTWQTPGEAAAAVRDALDEFEAPAAQACRELTPAQEAREDRLYELADED